MVEGHRDYFGNYGAPRDQGIYEISASQKYPLGTRHIDAYGRTFRYAKNGAGALAAGDLIQSAALAGADTTLQTAAVIAATVIAGAKLITVQALTTEQAADTFKDGWAGIFDASATAAINMRVKAHDILPTATPGNLHLYDALPVALTTSDEIALACNIFRGVIQAPATTMTGANCGGCLVTVTANSYFWAQTAGIFAVHIKDGALVAGDPVTTQPTTAGTPIKNIETLFQPHIGIATAAWADEKSGLIALNCDHFGCG